MWPTDPESLVARQEQLAGAVPAPWRPSGPLRVGACWACFPKGVSGPGHAGDPTWVAAVVVAASGRCVGRHVERGAAAAPYVPGMMALRVGALLDGVVRALPARPDVLLLDATGRDHPRRAGLALHLGAELDLPTVGVTHRPLLATGDWPPESAGSTAPLLLDDEVVGCWLRARPGLRPLAVHPGWRVDLSTAVEVVMGTVRRRTPEPLRRARHLARAARAADADEHSGSG